MISASSNEEGIMMMSASGATPFRPVLPTSLPAAMFVTCVACPVSGFARSVPVGITAVGRVSLFSEASLE